ncbi:MAG: DUF2934 domain-containing protein [Planctomycetota bacterium]
MAKKKATSKSKAKKADKASGKPAAKGSRTKDKPKTKAAQAKPKAVVVLSHDQIAAKAYEVWLQKGRPIGQDAANWDEAEAALRAEAGG